MRYITVTTTGLAVVAMLYDSDQQQFVATHILVNESDVVPVVREWIAEGATFYTGEDRRTYNEIRASVGTD